jgi:peptidyl-prolyl cis-trans isomerase SurA
LQEGRKRADDALRQAKATKNDEDFGMLAEKMSEDDYRVMMGYHKPVDRAKLPPYRGAGTAEDAARAGQRHYPG